MAGITLDVAQENLNAAVAALAASRKAKETQVTGSVGGRRTVRQELVQLQNEVEFWDRKVRSLSRGGIGFLQVVPRG